MNCCNPTQAWICGTRCARDGVLSPNVVFSPNEAFEYYAKIGTSHALTAKLMQQNSIAVPCGKCQACQIRKRKDMSVRLAHEASCHEKCCFLTLTYNDENIPMSDKFLLSDKSCRCVTRGIENRDLLYPTLLPYDVQCFIKRLRRHLEYKPKKRKDYRDHVDSPIRYFACGEYGSRTHRPHYHILIFGWSPSDKVLLKTHNGKPVYRSAQIEKLWIYGFSSLSDVSPYVAKYCARYVTKKFTRQSFEGSDNQLPEFSLQSVRNGGIGAPWFDKYGKDACRVGLCNLQVGDRVQKCSIPKYYWNRLRNKSLPLWLECRDFRIKWVKSHPVKTHDHESLTRSIEYFKYVEGLRSNIEVF